MQLLQGIEENPEQKTLNASSQINKKHRCQLLLLSRTSTENLKSETAKEMIDK